MGHNPIEPIAVAVRGNCESAKVKGGIMRLGLEAIDAGGKHGFDSNTLDAGRTNDHVFPLNVFERDIHKVCGVFGGEEFGFVPVLEVF